MTNQQQLDEQRWQTAKARVAFRWSFVCYFVVNAFLVAIWLITPSSRHYFWPMWSMLGWGLGLAFQYFRAYHQEKFGSTEQEYEKLKREEQQKNY